MLLLGTLPDASAAAYAELIYPLLPEIRTWN
jgi:hypothetical protein